MSLKAELERWVKALEFYDSQDYPQALTMFETIADSSKVLFNMGLIHATMGEHASAIQYFRQAHTLDQYLAVSFFQCGVSEFLLGQYTAAIEHFHNAYYHMRENEIIDYEQIGLKFRLYSAEILFNEGLSYICAGQQSQGMQLLDQARKQKQTSEHSVIDEAYAAYGRDFTVFSVPIGTLFRPSPVKVKNLKAKNYLGTAKLVAATEAVDAFVGFSGLGGRASIEEQNEPTPRVAAASSKLSPDTTLPLRLSQTKASSTNAVLSAQAASSSPPARLPRLNTDVPRPSLAPINNSASYQSAPAGVLPPTPPDSEPGPRSGYPKQHTRQPSSETTLDYLARRATGTTTYKRDTDFMEELVGGYSASGEVPPVPDLPKQPPMPQGQPRERVAAWADKQGGGNPRQGSGSSRYLDPYIPPSRSQTLNRYPTQLSTSSTGSRNRRAGSRDLDEAYIGRSNEMLSFRLKLHFEDDIRGMSLDSDTSWSVFYSRMQAKFGIADMKLKYKDEDGVFVTIVDEDDWDSAIDAAREHCPQGRQDGKLDIWVNEG